MSVSSEHGWKPAERAALGAALRDRVGDVVDRMHRLTQEARGVLEPDIEKAALAAAESTTIAVAEAIADETAPMAESGAGFEPGGFAALVGFQNAPVHEVIERCLRWRDCVASVLMDEAERLDISRGAVREALWLTLHTFDATLVRLGDTYELERQVLLGAILRDR